MDTNMLLSKIVANPTASTWSQVYSTLNLYLALSIKSEGASKSIVVEGKELLERIQREYFSESEKTLENIKKSIEAATRDIEDKKNISIVLATLADGNLYIVTVSRAAVILKRGAKIGAVAVGTMGEINAFSGSLEADDIIILETEDFSEKLPLSKLVNLLDSLDVTEISENLAPIIHNEPLGTEAAIILQYKKISAQSDAPEEENQTKEDPEEKTLPEEKGEITERKNYSAYATSILSKINVPNAANLISLGKKKIIIAAIILLALVLLGSIIFERARQEGAKREEMLSEILIPAEKNYEEANALTALNKGLALDEFSQIKETLTASQDTFAAGTAQRKKLDEFIGKVEGKIGELSAGSTLSNQKLLYEKRSDLVAFRGKQLFIINKETGEASLLSNDGTVEKTYETKNKNSVAATGNDTSVYLLGDLGVTQTDKKSGKSATAIEEISDTVALDTFGANLYGLNTKTKTVDKYAGGESPRSDYFKGSVTLNDPVSMSIDGSVWIIDGGKVRRFTKGTEDNFIVTGATKDISSSSQISTGVDYANVYILDPQATRIISIAKNGEVKDQYVSKELSNASSFAVDESGKKIYVVISGKLYSFDL